ncbi:ComEA family DNA-binding protein [Mycetocola tolaasinivorans]|uniref:ComEA family DNA-binding protein n=1 Tax=Mycetocola tolaasinivorans TaxID=76635 RepID=A0A3L7A922_9MICO|nr:ComEA family DNA-binding protein [Mycetocola tolaasinivorans]RLP76853.1 ComEA family DNA-binding protein [Mycetocola tolaasinivorans]
MTAPFNPHQNPPDTTSFGTDLKTAEGVPPSRVGALLFRLRELWWRLSDTHRILLAIALVVALASGVFVLRSLDSATAAAGDPEVGAPVLEAESELLREGPGSETSTAPSSVVPSGAEPEDALMVHVVGAVSAPGLYRMATNARFDDAVRVAGGPLPEANIAAVNLARKLVDGEQLRVPAMGEPVAGPSENTGAAGNSGAAGALGGGDTAAGGAVPQKVSLNNATAVQLETLPRVGPALAARIIEWRSENGPFRSVADLGRVSGFGPKMMASLREKVSL